MWEQIKIRERRRWIQVEFWCIPDLMLHLDNGFYFQAIHGLLRLRNKLITEKTFSINNKKLNFLKKISSLL